MVALKSMKSLSKKVAGGLAIATLGFLSFSKYIHYQYPTFEIEGVSMMPTVSPKSKQYTTRLTDEPSRYDIVIVNPSLLDSTHVKHPDGVYIKRLVGLPGDVLSFRKTDGSLVSINNKKIVLERNNNFRPFSMTSKMEETKGATFKSSAFTFSLDDTQFPVYVAERKAFASSDKKTQNYLNKFFNFPWLENNSKDSSTYSIVVPKGNYFVLSDNMVAGTDSRHFGPVPKDSVTYKVDLQKERL